MSNEKDLSSYRRDYDNNSIGRGDLDPDPIVQFGKWLQDAIDMNAVDATAMTLATATKDGIPSARIVLLKQFDDTGFCWYTDSRSQKGQELALNNQAALLFHWRDSSRQIRLQGSVEQLSAEDAESYFNSRPDGSRYRRLLRVSRQRLIVERRSNPKFSVYANYIRMETCHVPTPGSDID